MNITRYIRKILQRETIFARDVASLVLKPFKNEAILKEELFHLRRYFKEGRYFYVRVISMVILPIPLILVAYPLSC